MRVLLTNYDLHDRAGTQRGVGTLAAAFASRGDDVRLFSVTGNSLYPQYGPHEPGLSYDLALINHNEAFGLIRRTRMESCLYTAHGFTPSQEWVPPGADAYLAVDELTAAHIPWPVQIIRNPVDLDQFTERTPVSDRPRRLVFLSNKQGAARQLIEQACALSGLEFMVVGGPSAVDDPSEALNWADIVCTIGRGVIEAMACNRNVYAMDLYGAKGFVNHGNVERMRLDSYAGLLDSHWPDAATLAHQLLSGYDPTLRMRDYVIAEHSPEIAVDRYLAAASSLTTGQRGIGRALRRLGGPCTSRRTGKAISYLRLGKPLETMRELRGVQRVPPLLSAKLPTGVRVTFPEEF